uniref:Uncharacterized protein n=1 Tax=Amphimedon queenslandica TaxID=400682 RepID=A0A1X7SMP0_AMPQE
MEKLKLCRDSVYGYACKVLRVGLFYCEFCDAIREGDDDSVLTRKNIQRSTLLSYVKKDECFKPLREVSVITNDLILELVR